MLVLLFVSSLFDDVFFERFGGISLKLSLFYSLSLVVVVSRAPTLKKFFKKCSHERDLAKKTRPRSLFFCLFSDTNYMSIGVQIVLLKKLSGRCLLRLYIYIYRKRFYSDQTVHGARRGRYTTVWISSTIDKIFIYNRVLTCPRSGCTGVNKIKKNKRVHAQKVVDLSIGCLCGFQSRGDFRDRVVHLRVSLIP